MTTQETVILHCLACGRIEHAEPSAAPLQCCGHAMSKAATDTVPAAISEQESMLGDTDDTQKIMSSETKPR